MYIINVTWSGGPEWNNKAPSSFNSNKPKSATEHLIETGGQSIDEAIQSFEKFKKYPIKVRQYKPEKENVNWITELLIDEHDEEIAREIKNMLVEHYEKKQKQLMTEEIGYRLEIDVLSTLD